VVTHAPSLFCAWLVGGDVEALVDLPGVGDDDLAVEPRGEVECKLRLSNPGRTDDDGEAARQ